MRLFGRGLFGLSIAAAMLGVSATPTAAASIDRMLPSAPAKATRAVRRLRMAEPETAPCYRRSKNPRHRRPLRPNRLHISRRTRRRHRRQRRLR
jgi:hypothetical protein